MSDHTDRSPFRKPLTQRQLDRRRFTQGLLASGAFTTIAGLGHPMLAGAQATPEAATPEAATPVNQATPIPAFTGELAADQAMRLPNAEPTTMDPGVSYGDDGELNIFFNIFDGLVGIDQQTGEVVPRVAESWDINADATQFTFHIRQGVTWSDGTPLNANDFVYAWKRVLDPNTLSQYIPAMYPIKNAEEDRQRRGRHQRVRREGDRRLHARGRSRRPDHVLPAARLHLDLRPGAEARDRRQGRPVGRGREHRQQRSVQDDRVEPRPEDRPGAERQATTATSRRSPRRPTRSSPIRLRRPMLPTRTTSSTTARRVARTSSESTPTRPRTPNWSASSARTAISWSPTAAMSRPARSSSGRRSPRRSTAKRSRRRSSRTSTRRPTRSCRMTSRATTLTRPCPRVSTRPRRSCNRPESTRSITLDFVFLNLAFNKTVARVPAERLAGQPRHQDHDVPIEDSTYSDWRASRETQPFGVYTGSWGSDFADASNWFNQNFTSSADHYRNHWKNDEFDQICATAVGNTNAEERDAAIRAGRGDPGRPGADHSARARQGSSGR